MTATYLTVYAVLKDDDPTAYWVLMAIWASFSLWEIVELPRLVTVDRRASRRAFTPDGFKVLTEKLQ